MNEPDELLTPAEMSARAKITESKLRELSRGPNPVIPSFRLGRKNIRYHWRTAVASMAAREGIGMEIVAAGFGKEKAK